MSADESLFYTIAANLSSAGPPTECPARGFSTDENSPIMGDLCMTWCFLQQNKMQL